MFVYAHSRIYMDDDEIYQILFRLSVLVEKQPNAFSELKEKQNLLRKKLVKADLSRIVSHVANAGESTIFLLLLQAVIRCANHCEFIETLCGTLCVLLGGSICNYSIVNSIVQLISILAVKTWTGKILDFFTNYNTISTKHQLSILLEIPNNNPPSQWANEVIPLAATNGMFSVVEAWIPVCCDDLVIRNWVVPTTTMQHSNREEILLQCCQKSGLKNEMCGFAIEFLQTTQTVALGSGMAAILTGTGTDYSPLLGEALLHAVSLPMEMNDWLITCENALTFLEKTTVCDLNMLTLILTISAFPDNIENKFPYQHELHSEYKTRIAEIRVGCRGVLRRRKWPVAGLSIWLSSLDWRKVESGLHALSTNLFEGSVDLLTVVSPHSSNRAVLCTFVICLTSLKQFDKIEMVLKILATVSTHDFETGWFDFRSKQDNACVVYLQLLVPVLNNTLFIHDCLCTTISGIKKNIYYDKFRQTRDIFVSSIAKLDSNAFDLVCEDCLDAYNYISGSNIKCEVYYPFFQQNIERFLFEKSLGAVALISLFVKRTVLLDGATVLRMFAVSMASGGSVLQWVDESIVQICGKEIIFELSQKLEGNQEMPGWWYSEALSVMPELEMFWLDRIFKQRRPVLPECYEYCDAAMRRHVVACSEVYTRWLIKQSASSACAFQTLHKYCQFLGIAQFEQIMNHLGLPKSLLEPLHDGDYKKVRKVLKHIP